MLVLEFTHSFIPSFIHSSSMYLPGTYVSCVVVGAGDTAMSKEDMFSVLLELAFRKGEIILKRKEN